MLSPMTNVCLISELSKFVLGVRVTPIVSSHGTPSPKINVYLISELSKSCLGEVWVLNHAMLSSMVNVLSHI